MAGTILVLDSVSTNRIVLRVKLESACYDVIQCDTLDAALKALQSRSPKLIIAADNLPGVTVVDMIASLRQAAHPAHVPVVVTTGEHGVKARLDALIAGADDVLDRPVNDRMLVARLRALLRDSNASLDLHVPDLAPPRSGFAEAGSSFDVGARVDIVCRVSAIAQNWAQTLSRNLRHRVSAHLPHASLRPREATRDTDILVLIAPDAPQLGDLSLITEWRARAATRHAAIIVVLKQGDPAIAADVFDLGGNDVLIGHDNVDELALRIQRQIVRKRSEDAMRKRLRTSAEEAMADPLTGLRNRRYALFALDRVIREAQQDNSEFALIFGDLDRFKAVNDEFGHSAGDAVLRETAKRLRGELRPDDILARIGGEEFLAILPNTSLRPARVVADRLRCAVGATPMRIAGDGGTVPRTVTISLGVAIGCPSQGTEDPGALARRLLDAADRALYAAKEAGRDSIRIHSSLTGCPPRRARTLPGPNLCDIPTQGQVGTFNL